MQWHVARTDETLQHLGFKIDGTPCNFVTGKKEHRFVAIFGHLLLGRGVRRVGGVPDCRVRASDAAEDQRLHSALLSHEVVFPK
jgi:hypothetical protein